jgi:hypothetical protein
MKSIIGASTISVILLFTSGFALSHDKLILHCSFDKPTVSGVTVTDLSDNGNNLTCTGSLRYAADCLGVPERAMALDGATFFSRKISSATVGQIGRGDFTLGIMFRTTYQTGSMEGRFDIAGMGDPYNNGFFLSLHMSRGRIFLGDHGYYDTQDTLSTGKWYFLLATRSSGNVTLYLDGKITDQGAYTDAVDPVTDTFTVGKHGIKAESYFKGDIDQVVFYGRALSDGEVQSLQTEFTSVPITILAPLDSVISTPLVFRWSSMKSAVAYALEIDTGIAFSNPVLSVPMEDTSFQVSAPLRAGRYFFRIGSNSDDRSPFYFTDPKRFVLR